MDQADMEVVNEDKLLRIEAEEVLREIAFAVASVELSKVLPTTTDCVYMNVQTKEGDNFCIELTVRGFRVVGKEADHVVEEETESQYYETIYALLDAHSPAYRHSFGDALMSKLASLQQQQDEDDH